MDGEASRPAKLSGPHWAFVRCAVEAMLREGCLHHVGLASLVPCNKSVWNCVYSVWNG